MSKHDIRGLDIAMLRTFDALLRERSVSRAASRLFLSQPAVSASLKRLREAFGDELFTRTPHGVEPTPRALALAPRIDAVLLQLQLLLGTDGGFDPAGSDRILRIAGSDHTSRLVLPPICRKLTSMGSHLRLSWELADYSRMTERIRKGDIDLGLHPRHAPPANLESLLMYEDTYVALCRPGHPLLSPGLTLAAFCAAPHVVLGQTRSTLDDKVDHELTRLGHSRNVQAAVTTFSQMVDLLVDSDLISVFPQRVAARYGPRVQIVPMPFELPPYRLYLCWDARSNADGAVMWLKDELLQLCGSAQAAALPSDL